MSWIAPIVIGFGAGLALTPLLGWVAWRLGVIAYPSKFKIHKRPTPLLGGVAIYIAFVVATVLTVAPTKQLIGLLVGGLVAVSVGMLDEVLTLRPLPHLGGQIAAAVITIIAGVGVIHSLSSPFGALSSPGLQIPTLLGLALTVFWLVGMMNTVNLLDGLDGLAAGICALSALLLAIWAAEPSRFQLPASVHHQDLLLPLALVGAILGFLLFNWHPARIFMGDSGAMFLGLALGSLSIIGPAKLGTALLVLIVPVLDVAWAIVRRQLRGRSFLAGDKQHVYHRMMELGLSHTSTVLLLYFLCFALAGLDLFLLKIFKLVAILVLATVTAAAFILLEIRASNRRDVPETAPRLREASK